MLHETESVERSHNLEEFQNWLKNDSKLPDAIDPILQQRYLKVYNDTDLKKSQDLFCFNLKMRRNAPKLFAKRDVLSDEIQRAYQTMQHVLLPNTTPEGNKVTIIRLGNTDPSQFYYDQIMRAGTAMLDARFSLYDNDDGCIARGEYFVFDGTGMSFRHYFNMATNFPTARIYIKYLQEATPFRIKNFHLINCSSVIDKVFALIRPILTNELIDVIHFHKDGYETLYDFIPRSNLPEEYGGTLGPIDGIIEDNMEQFKSKRDYVMDDSNWQISS